MGVRSLKVVGDSFGGAGDIGTNALLGGCVAVASGGVGRDDDEARAS